MLVFSWICYLDSRQTDPLMKELTKNVWDFFRVLERGTILNQVQMNSAIVTKYVQIRELYYENFLALSCFCRISQLIGLENMVDICQPTIKMIQQECNESEPGKSFIFSLKGASHFFVMQTMRETTWRDSRTESPPLPPALPSMAKMENFTWLGPSLMSSLLALIQCQPSWSGPFIIWSATLMCRCANLIFSLNTGLKTVVDNRRSVVKRLTGWSELTGLQSSQTDLILHMLKLPFRYPNNFWNFPSGKIMFVCFSFVQEMMRHSPHMALTLSHLLTEDMEFRGFHFPKGTQVQIMYP